MKVAKLEWNLHPLASLPALAWCARVEPGNPEVTAWHGHSVETRRDLLVEGAWNGSFRESSPVDATVVCGTGAAIGDDGIRFFGSTDRLCPVFSIEKEGALFLSNSPIFVMSATGESPDPGYPFYMHDLVRIRRRGPSCLDGKLRLSSGNRMGVHIGTIVSVGQDGSVGYATHTLGRAPTDYQSYHALLLEGLQGVIANADAPARKHRYRPLAAISRGYDSCATAALAKEAGCSRAYTFTDSRREDPNGDSGAENAAHLGMECVVQDRWAYLRGDGRAEAETVLLPVSCGSPYIGFGERIQDSLIVEGAHGDLIWDVENSVFFSDFKQSNQSHASIVHGFNRIELRLRLRCLLLTPVAIGARHLDAINRISTSLEMEPWSVGGAYDRPIPRRIAEEAGIPREAFGCAKLASAHSELKDSADFSEPALADYLGATVRRLAGLPRSTRYFRLLSTKGYNGWLAILNLVRASKIIPRPWWGSHFPFKRVPWKFLFTLQWAFETLQKRYRLDGVGEVAPENGAKGERTD